MQVSEIKLGARVRIPSPGFEGRTYVIEDVLLTERNLRLIIRSEQDTTCSRDEKAVDLELVV